MTGSANRSASPYFYNITSSIVNEDETLKKLCPRCNSETLELDTPTIEAAKRKIQVSLRQCPKCKLLFYEGT
jgi:hypothetical protein